MSQADPLVFLLYVSRNAIPEAELPREIAQILESSRRNNAAAGITGALLYARDSFAQALEGPESALEALYHRLLQDPRHGDLVVLATRTVRERRFSQWSMTYAGRRDDLDLAELQAASGSREVEGMLLEGASAA